MKSNLRFDADMYNNILGSLVITHYVLNKLDGVDLDVQTIKSEAHKGIKHSVESKERCSRSVSEALKSHREFYKHYKSTGGELKWNAFRKKLKEEALFGNLGE